MITIYYYTNDNAQVINPVLAERQQIQSQDLTQYRDENWTASRVNVSLSRLNEVAASVAAREYSNLVSLQVQEDDGSYRNRALMQRPQLVLKFSLPEYVEIPVGAWCNYQGERYVLTSAQNIKKNGTRNIEYTMTMGTYQDNLTQYKMRNSVDGRLKYSMCSTPTEFVQEIVANLNARDGANVWHVGDCIDVPPKTVEFNHSYIDAALSQIADVFETEWEINNYYISLHPVKYNEDSPLPLSYGKGNGFMPGVGRTTPSNEQPVKRLYVQGGDKNIDRSTYGSADLLLPISQTLRYDGEHFEGETGFDSTKARQYRSSADGLYIERIDQSTDSSKEDSIECEDIYPSRVGYVTSVVQTSEGGTIYYDIIDNTIPNDLDYWDDAVRIAGETMTIIFQTGMLAGKEFDIQRYDHATRKFFIVPQEIDGQTMPNATFTPAVADTYAIFGCMLPQAYICDNNTKTGASWDMFREAVRYLYEHECLKFTFTGTLQGLWAKRNWANISDKLKVGGYIHFSDTQFAPDGTDIRIIGIKDYLTAPYEPTLDISNSVMGQTITTVINQVSSQEVVIGEYYDSAIAFTKRRFRDAKETMQMLENSLLNFSNSINPVAVQTMQLLVGDESLQFRFVDYQSQTVVNYQVQYNNQTKRLSCPAGHLQHMTLGIGTLENNHAWGDYAHWSLPAFTSAVLSDATKSYYLYAKVSRTNNRAEDPNSNSNTFILSDTAIGMESVTGFYHLLVGILNSEIDGERSYVDLYGFSEILPGRITTDKIISNDGLNWFDLVNGHIQANSIEANHGLFRGTFRSPFHASIAGENAYQNYDHLYINDVYQNINLSWDVSQSGRKILVVGSGILMTPPSGMYYYINGDKYPAFCSFDKSVIELIGYGDENDFYGWILIRHGGFDYSVTTRPCGIPLKPVVIGYVRQSASGYGMQIKSHSNYSGTPTYSHVSTGVWSLTIPSSFFGNPQNDWPENNMFVMVTSNSSNILACRESITVNANDTVTVVFKTFKANGTHVDGYYSGGNTQIWHPGVNNVTPADGAFSFIIFNPSMWNNIT